MDEEMAQFLALLDDLEAEVAQLEIECEDVTRH